MVISEHPQNQAKVWELRQALPWWTQRHKGKFYNAYCLSQESAAQEVGENCSEKTFCDRTLSSGLVFLNNDLHTIIKHICCCNPALDTGVTVVVVVVQMGHEGWLEGCVVKPVGIGSQSKPPPSLQVTETWSR